MRREKGETLKMSKTNEQTSRSELEKENIKLTLLLNLLDPITKLIKTLNVEYNTSLSIMKQSNDRITSLLEIGTESEMDVEELQHNYNAASAKFTHTYMKRNGLYIARDLLQSEAKQLQKRIDENPENPIVKIPSMNPMTPEQEKILETIDPSELEPFNIEMEWKWNYPCDTCGKMTPSQELGAAILVVLLFFLPYIIILLTGGV